MPLGNPIRKQNESRMVSVLATEGQTVFTVQGGYIINHISVFRNGVRLSHAEDFTAGDGSTVTLNNAANIDDRIDFHIFDRFTVQNAIVGAASSQIISGDLTLTCKLFGELDVPSINTGIVTATELDLNGNVNVSGISTFIDIDARNITCVAATLTGHLNVGTGITITASGADADRTLRIDGTNGSSERGSFIIENKASTSYVNIKSSQGGGDPTTKISMQTATGFIGIGTVTPARLVHQHVDGSGANYHSFTNSTTGVSATNGILVGLTAAEEGLLWNYGSAALRFATNNTERLRIASDGHVKFGDGDPVAVAAVEIENANPVLLLRDTAATSASGDCKYSFGNASHYPVASISHSWDGTNGGLHFYTRLSGTETERLTINSTGLVGIGTDNPSKQLSIYGDSDTCIRLTAALGGAASLQLGDIDDTVKGAITFLNSDNSLRIRGHNNTDRMVITSTGVVGVNTVGARGATFEIQDIGSTGPCLLLAGATDSEGDIAVPIDQDISIGHWNNSDTYTGRLLITSAGRTLIGTGAVTAASNLVAQGGLQVSANGASGAPSLCVGADGSGADTQSLTNNTIKDCRIGYPNYSISEEPIALISGFVGDGSALTDNNAARIYIGGGTSYLNSANQIRFYTNNTNITTTTGTERMRILPNGNIHIGTQAGINNANIHLEKVNAGGDVAIRIHNDTSTDSGSTASLLFTVSPTDNFDAQILRYYRESNNFVVQYSTNNPTIVLTNDQKLRVGGAAHTVDPICGTGGIDIQSMGSAGAFPFVGGADGTSGAVTRSSNTEKQFRMGYPTYGNGSGTMCTFAYMKASSSDNVINIGGGTGWGYAATQIDTHVAGTNTTSTGSLWSRIDHDNTRVTQYWNLVDGSMWNNSDAVDGMAFQGTGRGSMQVVCNRANGYANIYLNKTNTGSGSDVRFVACYWNGNAEGNLQYNTSSGNVELAQESDYRLKKNVADMTNGIDKVKQLRPVTYQWNDLSTKPKDVTLDGFIAHEVAEIIPQAVMGAKDATKTDEDGNENVIAAQEVEQKNLIPTLTAALKEAIAKIETLETKGAALEG